MELAEILEPVLLVSLSAFSQSFMQNGKACIYFLMQEIQLFVEYLEQLDDSEESDDEDILGEIEQLKRKGKWFEKEVCSHLTLFLDITKIRK